MKNSKTNRLLQKIFVFCIAILLTLPMMTGVVFAGTEAGDTPAGQVQDDSIGLPGDVPVNPEDITGETTVEAGEPSIEETGGAGEAGAVEDEETVSEEIAAQALDESMLPDAYAPVTLAQNG